MIAWLIDNTSSLVEVLLAASSLAVCWFVARSKKRVITFDKLQNGLRRGGYSISADGEKIEHVSGLDTYMDAFKYMEFLKSIYEERTGQSISLKDVEYLLKGQQQSYTSEKLAMQHHYRALEKEQNKTFWVIGRGLIKGYERFQPTRHQ